MLIRFRFHQTWADFAQTTSIHGLLYCWKRLRLIDKAIWWFIVLTMLLLCLWASFHDLLEYFEFKVKTSIEYKKMDQIQFPAITLCDQHDILKSKVVAKPVYMFIYAIFWAPSFGEVPQEMSEQSQACAIDMKAMANGPEFEELALHWFSEETQRLFSKMSLNSLVKCWWNDVEFNCSGPFANHFMDTGLCFTFFPVTDMLDFDTTGYVNSTYGINKEAVQTIANKSVLTKTIANKSGLKLMLNTSQHENCGFHEKYQGAGYRVIAHDPLNSMPNRLDPFVVLSPGYEYDIALKPTVFVRKTAHLGFCQPPIYAINSEKYYFQSTCLLLCFLKRIVVECGCFPLICEGFEKTLKILLNYDLSNIRPCNSTNLPCTKTQQQKTIRSKSPVDNCPQCIQACYETKYDMLITSRKYPPARQWTYIREEFNNTTDLSIYRRSYLIANFYLDTMVVQKVVETQAFTFADFMIYFGGNIGLFLGMSFQSLWELGHFLLSNVLYFADKFLTKFVIEKKANTVIHLKNKKTKTKQKKRH